MKKELSMKILPKQTKEDVCTIGNNEIEELNGQIVHIKSLIQEMKHKMGHSSSCNIADKQVREECYANNIKKMKNGLITWSDKSDDAEQKLKRSLQERWNMKARVEIIQKELTELKNKPLQIETLENKKIQTNDEENVLKGNKMCSSTSEQVKEEEKSDIFSKGGENGASVDEDSKINVHRFASDLDMGYSHKKNIHDIETLPFLLTKDERISHEEADIDKLKMSCHDKNLPSTNQQIRGKLPIIVCDVSTQTSMMKLNCETDETASHSDGKRYNKKKVLPEILPRSRHTPKNYMDLHFKAKNFMSEMYHQQHETSPLYTSGNNNLCISDLHFKQFDSSYPQIPNANIYQTMATNSDYKSFKKETSNAKLVNSANYYIPIHDHHKHVYHSKDLEDILTDANEPAYLSNMKEFEMLLKSNHSAFNQQRKELSYAGYSNRNHQFRHTSCIANVNNEQSQFLSGSELAGKTTRNDKKDSKSYKLPHHKNLPFSVCPNDQGGTWEKRNGIFQENCRQTCSKRDLTNSSTTSSAIIQADGTLSDKMKDTSNLNWQRNTPISIRIVRPEKNTAVSKILDPIEQRNGKTNKNRHVHYPVSPKYKKPRNYYSAFLRKKKYNVKQCVNIK